MSVSVPKSIEKAIREQAWGAAPSDRLSRILAPWLQGEQMELFPTVATMNAVHDQVASGDFASNPEFCLVQTEAELRKGDPRLPLDRALFIAGSRVPGDDVLVAVRCTGEADPVVFVLDWERPRPHRWAAVMRIGEFVAQLLGR